VQASDNRSGLASVDAYFLSPSKRHAIPVFFAPRATDNPTANLTLTAYANFPIGAESGAYSLALSGAYQLTSMDRAGNRGLYSSGVAGTKSITVFSTEDTAPPSITDFFCDRQTIFLGDAATFAINCRAVVNDDNSGVDSITATLLSPSGRSAMIFDFNNANRAVGKGTKGGIYQVRNAAHTPEYRQPMKMREHIARQASVTRFGPV
jgi:hypothetical protein